MYSSHFPSESPDETELNHLSQALIDHLDCRLAQWFQGLETEIQNLRQQRLALIEELQQLEAKKQQMLSEGEESFFDRSTEALNKPLSSINQASHWQNQAQQQLISLETTLRTVFTQLEQDLQGYQSSLSQGLETLHSLGKQGEAKFLTYFNRFQTQLEQADQFISTKPQPTPISPLKRSELKRVEKTITAHYLGLVLTEEGLKANLIQVQQKSNKVINHRSFPLFWYNEINNLYNTLFLSNLETSDPLTKWKRGLEQFILTLSPENSPYLLQGSGLETPELLQHLSSLQGVILTLEDQKNESVVSQLISMVIETGLVKNREQVFVISEAIAVTLSQPLEDQVILVIQWEKDGVRIVGKIKDQIQFQSINYGIEEFKQDIICQFIYPQWLSYFQASAIPYLDEDFPQAGYCDRQRRNQLQQQLQQHPLGQALETTAKLVPLILQDRAEFTSMLMDQGWGIKRQEVIETIIEPFLENITSFLRNTQNHQLISPNQIICFGNEVPAFWYGVLPWLERQFIKAEITTIWERNEEINELIFSGLSRYPIYSHFRQNLCYD